MRKLLINIILPGKWRFLILRAIAFRKVALEKEMRQGKATRYAQQDLDTYSELEQLFTKI